MNVISLHFKKKKLPNFLFFLKNFETVFFSNACFLFTLAPHIILLNEISRIVQSSILQEKLKVINVFNKVVD